MNVRRVGGRGMTYTRRSDRVDIATQEQEIHQDVHDLEGGCSRWGKNTCGEGETRSNKGPRHS